MRWKHRLPRVDTDRQATDFVDHKQAVAGRKRTRSRSVPSRSLGDSSLAPLMIKTIRDENTNQYLKATFCVQLAHSI